MQKKISSNKQKDKAKNLLKTILFLTSLTLLIGSSGCGDKAKDPKNVNSEQKAMLIDKGMSIRFPEGSKGLNLIKVMKVNYRDALVSVNAPARIVASVSTAVSSKEKIILFDSPDFTSLYSQYRQTKTNINLFTKNLSRIKEMYDNKGATVRDVNQAENDLNLAKTTLTELEGRIRSSGFNPVELENSGGSAVWLISDVPESQLHEVQNGEQVRIEFNAFPDKTFYGHVKSIGDNVDPVTRSVKVRILMSNFKNKFIPGLFAQVDFGDPIHSVVVLPPSGVVTVDGKDYVFIEDSPGLFTRREVTIKKSASNEVIIINGLKDGESVVTDGAILLKGLSFGY